MSAKLLHVYLRVKYLPVADISGVETRGAGGHGPPHFFAMQYQMKAT